MKEFKFKTTKKIFLAQIIMNVYKIIKPLMFQSIRSLSMYTFKDTPIPFTSRR